MEKKIYYLSSCITCRQVLKEISSLDDFLLFDVKKENISPQELDALRQKVGSYELLFNKRSMLCKQMNITGQQLSEEQYRTLILAHYQLLKRPIVVLGEEVIVGKATDVIAQTNALLQS